MLPTSTLCGEQCLKCSAAGGRLGVPECKGVGSRSLRGEKVLLLVICTAGQPTATRRAHEALFQLPTLPRHPGPRLLRPRRRSSEALHRRPPPHSGLQASRQHPCPREATASWAPRLCMVPHPTPRYSGTESPSSAARASPTRAAWARSSPPAPQPVSARRRGAGPPRQAGAERLSDGPALRCPRRVHARDPQHFAERR